MIPIRSANFEISPSMWLDMKIVTPFPAASSLSISRTSTMPSGSSPFAGSSSISISGLWMSAFASPSLCALPRERFLAGLSAYSARRSLSIIESTQRGSEIERSLRINSRFSLTVRSGYE